METAILMGLVGIGYLANNSNRDEAHPEIHPELNTPAHSTVYDQNNFEESKRDEELLAKNIIDSMKKEDSKIVDNTQTYNNEHRRGNLNIGDDCYIKFDDDSIFYFDEKEENIQL